MNLKITLLNIKHIKARREHKLSLVQRKKRKSSQRRMAKPAMLLLLPFAIATQIEDHCQGVTVSDCFIGEDNIVDRRPFPAEVCERLCKLSNNCHFWRAHQDDSMESPECVHLGADYHKVRRMGVKDIQLVLGLCQHCGCHRRKH